MNEIHASLKNGTMKTAFKCDIQTQPVEKMSIVFFILLVFIRYQKLEITI